MDLISFQCSMGCHRLNDRTTCGPSLGIRVFDDMFVDPIRDVRLSWTPSYRARLPDGDDKAFLHTGVLSEHALLNALTGHVGGILP